MFPKGKGTPVPSDSQAREKLALYVYEYLLHIGAQKSAQTFLSEIRWEKNITLGEPPGFLHSWWCVFWDLYCAAPERRETCDHSSEAKAFHDYSAAAAPSPVMGGMPPGEGMPGGPMPPGFFQVNPWRRTWSSSHVAQHGSYTTTRYRFAPHLLFIFLSGLLKVPFIPPGHPNLGPMQRMSGPRGMGPMGPGPQNFGGGMRPPHNAMGPGMPGVNMGQATGRPWPNPNNANTVSTDCTTKHTHTGASGGGGPPGTPIMPSPAGWYFSYEMPAFRRFPMGPGSDGPLGAMAGMEPHHMNGSLGSGDMDGMNKNSPNNLSGISNPPGTPRDDGELSGNFLHSFQSENVSATCDRNQLLKCKHDTFYVPFAKAPSMPPSPINLPQ
uniref:Single stranded DNA binding protein 3b n=1 Tax=Xiphophorus couchianus TaxID=32473 RepID=A0A3B5LM22_9TELE